MELSKSVSILLRFCLYNCLLVQVVYVAAGGPPPPPLMQGFAAKKTPFGSAAGGPNNQAAVPEGRNVPSVPASWKETRRQTACQLFDKLAEELRAADQKRYALWEEDKPIIVPPSLNQPGTINNNNAPKVTNNPSPTAPPPNTTTP